MDNDFNKNQEYTFNKIYNEADKRYILFNKLDKRGKLIVEFESKFYRVDILNINNDKVVSTTKINIYKALKDKNLDIVSILSFQEEISLPFDFEKEDFKTLSDLKNSQADKHLGLNYKTKEIQEYYFINSLKVKDNRVAYLFYSLKDNEIYAYFLEEDNYNGSIILKRTIQSIQKTFQDTKTTLSNKQIDDLVEKIGFYHFLARSSYYQFAHLYEWLIYIINQNVSNEEDINKNIDIISIVYLHFINNQRYGLDKTINMLKYIKDNNIVNNEFFISLFKENYPKINLACKMAEIDTLKDFSLFTNQEPFDISFLIKSEDFKSFCYKEYEGKEILFLHLIENNNFIKFLDIKDKNNDFVFIGIYLSYLKKHICKNFNKDKSNIKDFSIKFLEEMVKIIERYDIFINNYEDRIICLYENNIFYIDTQTMLNSSKDIDVKDLEFRSLDGYIKKDLKNYNYKKEHIKALSLLNLFNLTDIENIKDIQLVVDRFMLEDIDYNNLDELLLLYLKVNDITKRKIETLKDFSEIKDDLKFFSK